MRNRRSDRRIVGWIVGWEFPPKAAKSFRMMVARDGVEPPTPAFSGLRSTKQTLSSVEITVGLIIRATQRQTGLQFALFENNALLFAPRIVFRFC